MDNEEMLARLRTQFNKPPDPPLEATRKFLESYCLDETNMESLRADIRYMAGVNTITLRAGLAGIEGLLTNPPAEEGALLSLIINNTPKVLNDPTDAGARAWLEEIAQVLREELDRVSH